MAMSKKQFKKNNTNGGPVSKLFRAAARNYFVKSQIQIQFYRLKEALVKIHTKCKPEGKDG